ncbi:MAG TPA: hypothetical protein VN699_06535 [Pirellulales bacterium]|nr:hypothetical protein [Pirellulales bacterium]
MDASEVALARFEPTEAAPQSVLRRESWAARRRRLRHAEWRRGQYRLMTMFQVVTAASVLFWACLHLLPSYVNWLFYGHTQQRLAMSDLGRLGGTYQSFLYGYKIDISAAGVARTTELHKRTSHASLQSLPIPISDDRLSCLRRVPNVEVLDLRCQPISDAGLVHLKRLRQLRELDLRGTATAIAGAAELRRSLPNCKIIR